MLFPARGRQNCGSSISLICCAAPEKESCADLQLAAVILHPHGLRDLDPHFVSILEDPSRNVSRKLKVGSSSPGEYTAHTHYHSPGMWLYQSSMPALPTKVGGS